MIDRRRVLLAGGAALAGVAFGMPARSASVGTLRVASLRFGSLSWVLETIRAEGIANDLGLNLEILDVATNQAGPVALLSGEADLIISDWMWALRQRGLGEKLKFAPYSSALGAVMVPKDSEISKLADLEGKKLGVAGGPIDKSWLLLRAYTRNVLGQDLDRMVRPAFGAAPLLTEEIRGGRIDAILNFWTYSARLAGGGYREILGMDEVLKELGVDPVPSLVGFIWRQETEEKKGPAVAAFLDAVAKANEVLRTSDSAWERIRDLVKPKDDAELAAIKAYYRSGIPEPWSPDQTRAAQKLTEILREAGGGALLGEGTAFDPKLFHAAGS
jgi:NitT/TauT family transport system substrate-binding protein